MWLQIGSDFYEERTRLHLSCSCQGLVTVLHTLKQHTQAGMGLQCTQSRRIRRAHIDDYIIPHIEQFLEAGTVIVEGLLKRCVSILAKVDANGSPARRELEALCHCRRPIVVESHAVNHRFIGWNTEQAG